MKPASIDEVIIAAVLAIALLIYLIRKNIRDEHNFDQELTGAFKKRRKRR